MHTAEQIDPERIAKERAEKFDIAWNAVSEVELNSIFSSLKFRHDLDGASREGRIREYRKWLALQITYSDIGLPPNHSIDEMWHEHILHTKKYFSDSNYLFGDYLHHTPTKNPKDPNYSGSCPKYKVENAIHLWWQHYHESIDYSDGACCCK